LGVSGQHCCKGELGWKGGPSKESHKEEVYRLRWRGDGDQTSSDGKDNTNHNRPMVTPAPGAYQSCWSSGAQWGQPRDQVPLKGEGFEKRTPTIVRAEWTWWVLSRPRGKGTQKQLWGVNLSVKGRSNFAKRESSKICPLKASGERRATTNNGDEGNKKIPTIKGGHRWE